MPERPLRDFPLFPLGLVALPTESVPLHIFEDRYRRMIEHCLQADGEEFGILWLSDEELKRTGCACEIEQVLERMEDGRMNILARGTRPFRLLERQDDLPYPAGDGRVPAATSPRSPTSPSAHSARELYGELVDAGDRPASWRRPSSPSWTPTGWPPRSSSSSPAKQQLLELRSENARLRLLGTLLSAAIERLELLERAQIRAHVQR